MYWDLCWLGIGFYRVSVAFLILTSCGWGVLAESMFAIHVFIRPCGAHLRLRPISAVRAPLWAVWYNSSYFGADSWNPSQVLDFSLKQWAHRL